MDLIRSVLLVVSGVLLAVARLIADYTKAWLPRIIDHLIDRAIKRLPNEQCDRFAEEWRSYVNDTPGDLRKLIAAVGFLFAAKKMADVPWAYERVGAVLLLALLAPLMFFTAVMIVAGGGPILLRQGSVRADGKRIRRLTFRTIVADPEMLRAISEGAKPPSKENDPRLTAVGRVLCALAVDRLPLLLNVLKGDISLLAIRQEFPQELFFRERTLEATRKEGGGSCFWAGAAGLMVILAFLSLASTPSKHTFPQIAEVSRIARSDTDTDKHKMHGVPLYLDIVVGTRVAAPIRELRDIIRERKLVTYIDAPCASACIVAFMGGIQRFMAPEAKLGFRRGSFPGITDEELAQEDGELAQENEAVSQGLNSLRKVLDAEPTIRIIHMHSCESDIYGCGGRFGGPLGVWVRAWLAGRASTHSIQWPTSDELREAGVITGVASMKDLTVWLRQGTLQRKDRRSDAISPLINLPIASAISRR
jgi:Bacterial sugar transferase